nr:hypothetical protein [Paracoccus rhizosphaerae]
MLDAKVGAEAVEVVVARGSTLSQAEEPVGELFAARHRAQTGGAFDGSLSQHPRDLHRRSARQVA